MSETDSFRNPASACCTDAFIALNILGLSSSPSAQSRSFSTAILFIVGNIQIPPKPSWRAVLLFCFLILVRQSISYKHSVKLNKGYLQRRISNNGHVYLLFSLVKFCLLRLFHVQKLLIPYEKQLVF